MLQLGDKIQNFFINDNMKQSTRLGSSVILDELGLLNFLPNASFILRILMTISDY